MPQLRRNILLGLIGVAVAGGLGYVAFRPEPVPVDLHTIEVGTLTVTVDVDGETRVRDVFEVAAPITGVALRSPVEVGDRVTEGQTVVARVEPVAPTLLDARTRLQAEAEVREAQAALHVARTDLTRANEDEVHARSQFNRDAELVDRGVLSLTRLEDAHQRLAVAVAAVEAAQARIDQARSTLERAEAALIEPGGTGAAGGTCCTEIAAPATGAVLEIDTISERPVLAGARLLSIGDPAELEIVADLLSNDAVRLPDQARATVERWGGPPLEAVLRHVEPAAYTKVSALGIDEQRVDTIFDLVSSPEERPALGHGFAVFLRIVEYEEPDVPLVPLSAAFRSGDGWAVFRAQGDVVERVPVELGRRDGRSAVVLSGLEAGDRVVVHPSDALEDGAIIVERTTF
ncbi:efflux RND transporter periplasmic adaptor subunit [Pontivivens ytuae]|uniref:RND transporter n=1 Tax=Pontivivens ytuae TaxID=2789856 RepID=A0A7S9QC24_9RHOB|nr:HlyD family efflux transporter periplasmic adaptor subunit [Pontivivens ytuae]QPH52942.1 RND transporter [Pontivivens ytuae]